MPGSLRISVSKLGLDKIVVRRIVPDDRPMLRHWLRDPDVQQAIQDETIDLSRMKETIALFESSDPFHDGGLGLIVEVADRPIGLITFKGSERTYKYEPNDNFIEDFAKVVLTKGSIGRLVNNYLKSGNLVPLS